jgi:hypothetical protein
VCRFNLRIWVYRWRRRRHGQVGPTTMVGDCWVNNLFPSIILDNFWLQIYIGRHRDTRNILGLEGRPLWYKLNNPLPNPIEKPILKNWFKS